MSRDRRPSHNRAERCQIPRLAGGQAIGTIVERSDEPDCSRVHGDFIGNLVKRQPNPYSCGSNRKMNAIGEPAQMGSADRHRAGNSTLISERVSLP